MERFIRWTATQTHTKKNRITEDTRHNKKHLCLLITLNGSQEESNSFVSLFYFFFFCYFDLVNCNQQQLIVSRINQRKRKSANQLLQWINQYLPNNLLKYFQYVVNVSGCGESCNTYLWFSKCLHGKSFSSLGSVLLCTFLYTDLLLNQITQEAAGRTAAKTAALLIT